MKRNFRFLFAIVLFAIMLTACTDKAKQDADKLTNDIVDYAQTQVDNAASSASEKIQDAFDNAKEYLKEQAGVISEKVVDGLSEAAKDVKDEAEDMAGAIKDDLSENVGNVISEVKDDISDALHSNDKATPEPTEKPAEEVTLEPTNTQKPTPTPEYINYRFRNYKLLDQHYEKHGKEMNFASREDYEKAASDVINNPKALHKTEAEDGDDVYYVEETNEFVILSKDGYIRTYFLPSGGKKYYDRQ